MTQLGFDGRPPQGLPFFKFPLTEFCSSVSIASVLLDRGRAQATVTRNHSRDTICRRLDFTCRDHGSSFPPLPFSPFFSLRCILFLLPLSSVPTPQFFSQDPPFFLMTCFCQQKELQNICQASCW